MPTTSELQEVGQLNAQIQRTTDPDARMRLLSKLDTCVKKLTAVRKGEFSCDDDESPARGGALNIKSLYEHAARTDEEREVAGALDRLYLLSKVLAKDPRETREFRRMTDRSPYLARALDTGSASDWIPEQFTANFHDLVRLQGEVVQLFEQVPNMPTSHYKMPVEGSDATPYRISQQGGADADLDVSKRIKSTLSSPGLTNVELIADKSGARITISAEAVEESIVPMIPYLTNKMARALSRVREDASINGKGPGGGDLDSDWTGTDDHRKSWFGLRAISLDSAMGNGAAVVACANAGRAEIGDLRKLRSRLGKFATRVTPGDVVIACSAVGYNVLLNLTDSNGNPIISTVDKYGAQATLVQGELARLDGMPILTSSWVRDDLSSLTGLHDGVTSDSTCILMLNRRQFLFGTYRNPQIRSQPLLATDQLEIYGLQRCDMKAWFPTQPACGFLYDVKF